MKESTKNKIEEWTIAIVMTVFAIFIFKWTKEKWNKVDVEKREKFKKGCIKDFKIACILTLIIFTIYYCIK